MSRASSSTPSSFGRPPKDGVKKGQCTKLGVYVPGELADAIKAWGDARGLKAGERVEQLLELGLTVAPKNQRPIDAAYTKAPVQVWATPVPALRRRVERPVKLGKTNMTRRVFALLHYAMLAEGAELPTSSAQQLEFPRTGTNG